MLNNLNTNCGLSPEELIAQIREACKDIADYRPEVIEMRPDYYDFIKENSMYMDRDPRSYTPYYYGVKVEVKEDLDVPYRIMRGGEEVSE